MRKLAAILLTAITFTGGAQALAAPVSPNGSAALLAHPRAHAAAKHRAAKCRRRRHCKHGHRANRVRHHGLKRNSAIFARRTAVAAPAAPASPPVSSAAPAPGPPVADGASSSPAGPALPAGLAEPFAKGINASLRGWGTAALPDIAGEIHSLGANWAREDVAWSKVETSPGVYDWAALDATFAAASAHGLTVLPVIGYAPAWTAPEDASGFAGFVAAVVARYGPGTAMNLPWFELWNEPMYSYAWSGKVAEPEAYARDVRAAAQAAKSIAPGVKLLMAADYENGASVGGTTPWQFSMVDDYFAAVPDLGAWIDGVSVHPYGDDPALPVTHPAGDPNGGWRDASGGVAFQRIDTIRGKFLAHGVNVPFWITEEGWSTWDVSEAQQATNYQHLFAEITARPWIRALFPFGLREGTANPKDNQPGFALEHYGTWAPKPAFGAVQAGFASLS